MLIYQGKQGEMGEKNKTCGGNGKKQLKTVGNCGKQGQHMQIRKTR